MSHFNTQKPITFSVVFWSFITLLFVLPFSMSHAQTAEEFGNVINLSGKQRMLTQKMSKEAVLIGLEINTAENLKNLENTATLFDKTLKGLRSGDASLKLPPTSSPRILKQLDRVDALWAAYYPIVKSIITNKAADPSQIEQIAEQNLPLLKQMNRAVGAYEKEAAKGGLKANPGLATTINLSGKQRMLTQKMSKEFFLVAHQHMVADNKLNLLETFTLFERTLQGLKAGDESLGLPITSDATILGQLDKVSNLWQEIKPLFEDAVGQGSQISAESIQKVATLNLPLLKEMNKAVGMYEAQTK
ncbi:type IV pili methyl-accepting chemotaxis transducer N-terminal domain-containing protein [Glaciecola petra]|uniref:Type IV pili methyl-accepting chemotaxis transducer N-terminal domain-containing protein n=1 Tax=Glaciecola petra TaxID=3075602 RepID=A0ABU2ZQR4_9ALTE|nr:type IV pili methyl-accepting chemotaxis transducer N-terminal domain-containing protein [Aestuariibacter sp. P117]MDT0594976.1 type IV pili methyl-accepting chemotaxis transducer N-terminal domain-containing protein [Aestuariibacter sp. P117]